MGEMEGLTVAIGVTVGAATAILLLAIVCCVCCPWCPLNRRKQEVGKVVGGQLGPVYRLQGQPIHSGGTRTRTRPGITRRTPLATRTLLARSGFRKACSVRDPLIQTAQSQTHKISPRTGRGHKNVSADLRPKVRSGIFERTCTWSPRRSVQPVLRWPPR